LSAIEQTLSEAEVSELISIIIDSLTQECFTLDPDLLIFSLIGLFKE